MSTTRAFTAIEVLVTLSIAILLGTMSVVGTLPALRRGRVAESLDILREMSNDARRHSRACVDPATRFGLRIDGSSVPNRIDLLRDDEVIASGEFDPISQIFAGEHPLTGVRQWWYQPRTGFPFNPTTGQPIAVGAGARGTPDHLSLRTIDQQVRTAFAIYSIGVVGFQDF